MRHAEERGAQPAIREKDLGIWQTWTWRDYAAEVRALACGLAAQGLKRGDHIALVGDNRPRIYAGICAAQCLGAIPVPLYQDAVATEMAFPIQNAEIAHAIVEDQEQVDKLLEILPSCPSLKHVYYDDPRGLRHYSNPALALLRKPAPGGQRIAGARPGVHRRRDRQRPGQRYGRDVLYLRDHRGAERRRPDAREPHRPLAHHRGMGGPHRPRRGARLHAAGLDRAEHLFLRAAACHRLLHLLPRIDRHGDHRHARDRPHLLLRAASRIRGAAHAGFGAHGGRRRAEAPHVPLLHGRRPARRRAHPGGQARQPGRPRPLQPRRSAGLRAAAQRPRHEPRTRSPTPAARRSGRISSSSTARSAST